MKVIKSVKRRRFLMPTGRELADAGLGKGEAQIKTVRQFTNSDLGDSAVKLPIRLNRVPFKLA